MPATEIGLDWQVATIDSVTDETYRTKTFRLSLPDWRPFRPGQHMDVRLTAPDGYQAQRSYSIASAPETTDVLDLTVELVEEGEVSSWFHEVAQQGDTFELRGPIGGPFTWTVVDGGPLLLVAGGSGVVPLMSMLRHRKARGASLAAVLLYSSRTIDDVFYRDELLSTNSNGLQVIHTLTRGHPHGWTGETRRIDQAMLTEVLADSESPSKLFICGPTAFVESVAAGLVATGVDVSLIRTERFGPTA